jgi:hypothetical protein
LQAGPRLQTAQRILDRVIGDYRRERDVLASLQARVSTQLENARRPFEGLIRELIDQLEQATAREKQDSARMVHDAAERAQDPPGSATPARPGGEGGAGA